MMGERIDILMPNIDKCAQFTVDTTVVSVDLVSVTGNREILYAAGVVPGVYQFQRGDSFIILSAGYLLPCSFSMFGYEEAGAAKWSSPVMYLSGYSGADKSISTFGNNGLLNIPFSNYEFSLGVFTDPEAMLFIDPSGFSLKMLFPYISGVDNPQVSMLNVPAVLHGTIIKVVPFIKVLHNFPLT